MPPGQAQSVRTVITRASSSASEPVSSSKAGCVGEDEHEDEEVGDEAAEFDEDNDDEDWASLTAGADGADALHLRQRRSQRRSKLLGPVLDEAITTSLGAARRESILAGAGGGVAGVTSRREARRQAARGRFQLNSPLQSSPADSRSGRGAAPADEDGSEDVGGEDVVVLPVEVVMDQAVLTVPHDESPTRIYELSELWEEAVGQVRGLSCGRRRWGR